MAMAGDIGAEKGEVSGCVHNLIHAFSNGLDIFKRLRERRRKRKSRKQGTQETESSAELQLSESLKRGPAEIRENYDQHLSKAGDRFAKGDAIAHASLAETLIKLNTGLVGIIAAFLNHDSKSTHLNLDYKSLTNLSNASRAEAVGSLNQLYQRLSQSQLQVYRVGYCARCGSSKHQNCSGGIDKNNLRVTGKSHHSGNRKHTSSRSKTNGPTVARIPIKSSSQTQLVVVRPRNTRKDSASSSSSSKSRSTATASPYASPPLSPLPQYAAVDPYASHLPTMPNPNAPNSGRRRASSIDGPRPNTWPHTHPNHTPLPHASPPKPKPRPKHTPTSPLIPPPLPSPPLRNEKSTPIPISPPNPIPTPTLTKRRMDKITPSTYTFASDSTKLGEIPQRDWAKPWDYEEAERLNREGAGRVYPVPGVGAGNGEKQKKRGLFGFLRRGES